MKTIYLAKWESRFWAWLVDILIVGAFSNAAAAFLNFRFEGGVVGINSLFLFAYWLIMEGYGGQSIGKMALNLEVTDRKGGKIDFGTAAAESFGKAFLLPIDCLVGWIAMPGSKMRLFNRVSGTIVVKAKSAEPKGVKYVKEKE